MNKRAFFIAILLLLINQVYAQKEFTLEEAFSERIFQESGVTGLKWMKDGASYTDLQDSKDKTKKIVRYDVETGGQLEVLFDQSTLGDEFKKLNINNYSFGPDEVKIVLSVDEEAIYRRSRKSFVYVYDRKENKIGQIGDPKVKKMYPTISPDGKWLAFVQENNLYIYSFETKDIKAVTTDGKMGQVINGAGDWVSEEEFTLYHAFKWSPDSKRIAYYRFDESMVKEYNMQIWGGLYPEDYRYKYPKAGEDNAKIEIYVYHIDKGNNVKMKLAEGDFYFPRIYWLPNSNVLSILKLNRPQNKMEIIHANVFDGTNAVILTEESDTFVDVGFIDDITYLKSGEHFIRTSEKSGFKHIYLYSIKGKELRQITSGEYEVDRFLGFDEKSNTIFYTSTEGSPIERHLYSISIDGRRKKKMTQGPGVYDITFGPGMEYYIQDYSSQDQPTVTSLCKKNGKQIKVLEDNAELKKKIEEYGFVDKEFIQIKANDGTILNGYIMKPIDIGKDEKLPVLMHVYGGPGRQTVLNSWGGQNDIWHQYLVGQGYIVVSVDNRGTDGRGIKFKHVTYGQMGKLELEDQITVATYLSTLNYVDPSRIGIWGWSYGGYLSSLCLFKGHDYFKIGIAVAPVANWRYYDTIYTERYQNLPGNNPKGYDDFSPLTHVGKLEGNYLLVHGTGDDNVHFQNSVALQDALIKANKQFQSFYYPNKNHGIYGGNTRYHLYTMMTNFVKRNL